MKKKKFIFILIIFGFLPLYGQYFMWEKTYGSNERDFSYWVEETFDKGFVIAGLTNSFGATADVYLIKTDREGNVKWQKIFDKNGRDDGAYCVKETFDKGFILVGTTLEPGYTTIDDIYLIKTNAWGNLLWDKVIGVPSYDEEAFESEQTRDGGYIIVGDKKPYSGNADIYIVKTDASGNVVWEKTYGHPTYHDVAYGVETVSDGYIITGYTYCITGGKSAFLMKVDLNGEIIWWKNIVDGAVAYDVKKTKDGGYIICGIIPGSPEPVYLPPYEELLLRPPDGFLAKTDEQGYVEWVKYYSLDYGTIFVHDYFLSVQQTADGGYVVGGHTNYYAPPGYPPFNAWIVKTDPQGNQEWMYIQGPYDYHQYGTCILQASDGTYNLIGGKYEPGREYDFYLLRVYGNILYTDEPYGLAYNANRHLFYQKEANALHMVFTSGEKILWSVRYPSQYSWSLPPIEIGVGRFPAIAVDRQGNLCVCWTDSIGGLWYSKGGEVYHLYNPWTYWLPRLTSPPSMCITPDDTVHILTNLYLPANGIMNAIVEWSFPLQNPYSVTKRVIEDATYLLPEKVEYPSIAYSIDPRPPVNSNIILHAAWQHADTIYYATRNVGNNWVIWDWEMWNDSNRTKSSHPFVETYGDVVTLVWSRKTGIFNIGDIYKTKRYLYGYFLPSQNISQSPSYLSTYPVNSYDSYTLYTEMRWPQPDEEWSDIFLNGSNISNTPNTRSIFSHSQVKRTSSGDYLYVIYLEGNEPPYEIKFLTLSMGSEYITPYITSIAGQETPSPYLIKRDTFFSNWQIPVDIGYDYVKYRFVIYPGYKYVLKAIVYYEEQVETKGGKKYEEWIKIDKVKRLVKYTPFKPETVTINIPPAFYKDSIIDVVFEKKTGEYAIAGPIYIYRFEEVEEEFGKIENIENETSASKIKNVYLDINSSKIPFKEKEIMLYDLTGRNIKLDLRKLENTLLKAVYFIRIKDKQTGKEKWEKFIKIK